MAVEMHNQEPSINENANYSMHVEHRLPYYYLKNASIHYWPRHFLVFETVLASVQLKYSYRAYLL